MSFDVYVAACDGAGSFWVTSTKFIVIVEHAHFCQIVYILIIRFCFGFLVFEWHEMALGHLDLFNEIHRDCRTQKLLSNHILRLRFFLAFFVLGGMRRRCVIWVNLTTFIVIVA